MEIMEIIYGILIVVILIFAIYYYRRKKMLEIYDKDGNLSYDITKNGLRILGVYTSAILSGDITIPIKTKPNEKVSIVVGASALEEYCGSAIVKVNSITQSAVHCTVKSTAKAHIRGGTTTTGFVRVIVLGSMS